uniref:KIB1-4 beta-propeller domain-containing protein n=1 Tax=Oryza sativa subsp. japonica TaxID=39947 RepID=Q6ZLH1_ORYSJ|nr:hypothetical protein [Oryza sativa Japonica Group]
MGRSAPPSAPAAAAAPARGGRKRKRHLVTTSPAAQVGGWASLPTDLTRLVAGRVLAGDVVDYIAFRAVCSGWRACAPSPRDPTLRKHLLRPRAWVALCDGDAARPDDACEITFFHTRTARSLRVRLPELRCHRIVGFTDGLIILLHKRTTAVRVLNPFTGVAVDLPPLAPVFHQVVKNRNSLLYMLHQRHVSDDPHCRHRLIVQVYPPNPLGPVVAHVPAKFGDPDIQSPAPTT